VAEVKVVLQDEGATAGGRDEHVLGRALNELAFVFGVDFDGQMTVRSDDEQLSRWLVRLEAVLPSESAASSSFIGPVTHA
jgi:hypothetical protein